MSKAISELLIDFDLIAYESASLADGKFYHYPEADFNTPVKEEMDLYVKYNDLDPLLIETCYKPDDFSFARMLANQRINGILSKFPPKTKYRGFLTGKDNFRYEVATILPYKGNRVDKRKPVHLQELRQYLVNSHNAIIADGEEADDALGYNQHPKSCICSIDKDLDMIPGSHYNWNKEELYEVSEIGGLRCFYSQLLTGDATDNILGLFRVGCSSTLVKQISSATTEEEMKVLVYKAYYSRFGSYAEQFLNENGRLLYIRKNPNEVWSF